MGKQKTRSEDRLAIVRYEDLAERDHLNKEGIKTTCLIILETYGYVFEDKNLVRVLKIKDIGDFGPNNQVMTIPKGCIKKITYLKEDNKNAK